MLQLKIHFESNQAFFQLLHERDKPIGEKLLRLCLVHIIFYNYYGNLAIHVELRRQNLALIIDA